MTIDEIKQLVHLVNESGVAELELQRGENRVRIRRTHEPAAIHEAAVPAADPPPVQVISVVAAASPPAPEKAAEQPAVPPSAPKVEDTTVLVKSPIVGTYYDSPSPGSAPFVRVGDAVEPGQVLCIIESMKLMNEIEAEIAGAIASKLVENGRPVEYGEALFAVRPR